MDAFDFATDHQTENRVILIFHSFKKAAKFFRIIELCFLGFLLLWTSTRLPFAVKLSGEYFRQLLNIILSPLFIFLVSNFIVITLVFKSGKLSTESSTELFDDSSVENEVYSLPHLAGKCSSQGPLSEADHDIVYEDKEMISEVNNNHTRVPRRTTSEKIENGSAKEIYGKLRRSETDRCRKIENFVENPSEMEYAVDELSSEEFQKAIEDFIAKQIKFHQEEKLAIVLHSQV